MRNPSKECKAEFLALDDAEEGLTPAFQKSKTLVVYQLNRDVTSADLIAFFSFAVPVESASVAKDKAGASLGYAFVNFKSVEDGLFPSNGTV